MYLFNLCPFPVKANGHLYSWMVIPAMKNFPSEEVGFIGSGWQLSDPGAIVHGDWVYRMVGQFEHEANWSSVAKITVPREMISRISDSQRDPLTLLETMIKSGFHEYEEFLFREIGALHGRSPIKAAVTFVNCASLERVCAILNIPVIHMEAGYIREPVWKTSTFQFDFRGVNGNTEAAIRFERDKNRQNRKSRQEIADLLLSDEAKSFYSREVGSYDFEFGIPLQVDDDSNLVAFSNGLSNLDTLYIARKIFPQNLILARNHPLCLMKLGQDQFLATLDNSQNSLEFVNRCKRILTINSSVAFEAFMMGRATYLLGESALSHIAMRQVDRHLRGETFTAEEIDKYLDFIVFQYLIPYNLWMNKKYIDFRLTRPSEENIRNTHLKAYSESIEKN
ncbi:hypothetical protein [Rhizobium sp. FKL33]|uniref:GT99 family glycosyltransferase N-terminal domain-containing protein n=1 Tax=Rhizobium sp. FKL33 TaxID=2562307 RepID=UPI0010C08CA5|nr:hypothetical protein [Rhizobium sp. FKL33]